MPNIPILARGCIIKVSVIPFSSINPFRLENTSCPFPSPKAPILARGCIINASFATPPSSNPLSLTDFPNDIAPLNAIPVGVLPRRLSNGLTSLCSSCCSGCTGTKPPAANPSMSPLIGAPVVPPKS